MKPRNNYVLVERMESVTRSGLLIIPEVAQEKNMLGRIVAVGPGKRDEDGVRQPIEAKVGEVWYFSSKWNDLSPTHYAEDQLSDRKLHLVMEADLLVRKNDATIDKGRTGASSNSRSGKADQKRKATEADRHGRAVRHAATGVRAHRTAS